MMTSIYIIISILVLILCYLRWKFTYWQRRGVKQVTEQFIFSKKSLGESILIRYKEGKAMKVKYLGAYLFHVPSLLPIDPGLIKDIMIRDFAYFQGHGTYHEPRDILTMNLFSLEGENWRHLRAKLTPTFTSGKMKMMFETLVEKTGGLEKVVGMYADSGKSCAIKDILGRFTTDIIGSCAFGIECNSLEDPETEFRVFGKKVFRFNALNFVNILVFPAWFLGSIGFKFNGHDVTDFFTKVVCDTISHREKNEVARNDFMHLLLELKNKDRSVTVNEIIAQCFVFFLAGFETSSTAMTFALFCLSQNQTVQQKLRDEINEVLQKHDGNISYEAVKEMKYLDMVVNETLRIYPPLPGIPRVCSKDYRIPGTDLVIEKGTRLQIPVWGLHMDPDYYPNPEVFNPENFNEENKAKRHEFTFLPFGEGPRMCIGLRFGLMQTKVGLISLIKNFRFTLNEKTKTPVEMERGSIVLSVKGDVWLDVQRI
ncbi:cytochrome P450 6a2-like [Rhynchophorus ferrugineus]|uniref:cytochrome P450 6a2-like n=1 Tax=Rhynchophorus ferrugineus TaxID=354439 RepID=UPI003FCD0B0A